MGRTEGHIVPATPPSPGADPAVPAFGWDPIFRPLGFEETYAQIPKEVRASTLRIVLTTNIDINVCTFLITAHFSQPSGQEQNISQI